MLHRFDLSGRCALVTGASRGIGRALAVGLAEAGADLLLTARSGAALEETAATVRAAGRSATTITADLSATGGVAALFEAIAATPSAPDILINNAGVEEVMPSLDVTEAVWDKIVGTNLKAAFFVAQGFARQLAAPRGSIVNLGSLTSAVGIATATPYTASKTGIVGLTRALSAEWAPRIRVNAIGPGYFRTDMTEGFYADADWQARMLAKIPMGRFGELDDLVGATVFMAGDAAAYLTGQILYIDGGTLASI